MAFNLKAPLEEIVNILGNIPGIQKVYTGVPESVYNRISVYAVMGSHDLNDKITSGFLRRTQRYIIGFVYRVREAEAQAEKDLADLVDATIRALYSDRTLNGTVDGIKLDLSWNDSPDYRKLGEEEIRHYLVIVLVDQSEQIG